MYVEGCSCTYKVGRASAWYVVYHVFETHLFFSGQKELFSCVVALHYFVSLTDFTYRASAVCCVFESYLRQFMWEIANYCFALPCLFDWIYMYIQHMTAHTEWYWELNLWPNIIKLSVFHVEQSQRPPVQSQVAAGFLHGYLNLFIMHISGDQVMCPELRSLFPLLFVHVHVHLHITSHVSPTCTWWKGLGISLENCEKPADTRDWTGGLWF